MVIFVVMVVTMLKMGMHDNVDQEGYKEDMYYQLHHCIGITNSSTATTPITTIITITTTILVISILICRGRIALWDTGGSWKGEVEVGEGVVDKVGS